MKVINSKGFNKAIIITKILEDKRLLVVDNETTIRFMDKDSLKTLDGFRVNIHHERYAVNVVSFSNDGAYFATLTADCRDSRLYNVKTKKLITKVDRHQGEVSCVGIDPLDRYMFSCGDDGKTFAIDVKSGKLVLTLPSHVDTVNDIAFSKNGNWVATASYDRKISLFSLVTMTAKAKLKAHSAAVMHVRFINKNRLISIDKGASAIIWNLHTDKVIERLQGIHDDVTQITTSKDDKFLFIGTKLGYVLLYDLETYKLLSPRYIKLATAITTLEFDGENNTLFVGTDDGFVMTYNIYEDLDTIKDMLRNKNFDAIQGVVEGNPVLQFTEVYKMVSNLWENTLTKARIALENGEKEKALTLFSVFKNIPSKNKIIQKTIADYADFDKFVKFAKEGKLPLAYGLAKSFPIYKESKIYKSLEARWKKVLMQAQKYILDPKGAQQAKDIFMPYRGISEKTALIQEILTQSNVYKRFRAALGKKDFVLCSELMKKYKFLKEIPEYDVLMKYADTLYIKSHEFLNSGDTHSAMKMLRNLAAFDDFKEEAKEMMLDIETKQKFFNAIADNDMETAYNMMAISEDLEYTKDGRKLQKAWSDASSKAGESAVNGDAKAVEVALQEYMHISSKLTAIATIFAWCYMVELEDAARDNAAKIDIEKGIKNFILNFGILDQIENFYLQFKEKYPSTKLTLEHLKQGSLSMWRPSMIVDSILDET